MKVTIAAGALLGLALGSWTAAPEPTPAQAPVGRPGKLELRESPLPEDVREGTSRIRRAGSRDDRLRELVGLATRIPVGDFPRWFEGNHLEFLDGQLEGVFYRILEERWMEDDPEGAAKFMLGHGSRRLSDFLTAWLEIDGDQALDHVREMPAKNSDPAVQALVLAVGRRDVPRALELMEEFGPRMRYERDALGVLARNDRKAVLDFARGLSGERRMVAFTAVAAAALADDLPWVVATLQREGVGVDGLKDLVNHMPGEAGRAFLADPGALPVEWIEELTGNRGSSSFTNGSEVEWLDLRGGVAGLSDEVLARIQIQAAQTPWWYNALRADGIRLVEEGEWLPMEARAKIAETLMLRWQDDPQAARAFTEGLDGELRDAAEKGLASLQQQIAHEAARKQLNTPAGLVEALASDDSRFHLHGVAEDWPDAELDATARLIAELDPAAAAIGLAKFDSRRRVAPEIPAALIGRALAGGNLPDSPVDAEQVSEVAFRWADESPPAAAAWAASLPSGKARTWAVRNVAAAWSHHDAGQARQWADELPPADRAAAVEALGTER